MFTWQHASSWSLFFVGIFLVNLTRVLSETYELASRLITPFVICSRAISFRESKENIHGHENKHNRDMVNRFSSLSQSFPVIITVKTGPDELDKLYMEFLKQIILMKLCIKI